MGILAATIGAVYNGEQRDRVRDWCDSLMLLSLDSRFGFGIRLTGGEGQGVAVQA